MKIAMMGAGGVGGYFGCRLAQGSDQVSFIARGKHLEAMRSDGLYIESPEGNLHLQPVVATDNPAEIGPVDLVILSVKLWDTEEALKKIKPVVGSKTTIVSLQNGVTKDELITAAFGKDNVIGGVCYISSYIERPGVIKHAGRTPKLIFGEYDGKLSERVESFFKSCQMAKLDTEISKDIRKSIWEKFVFLVSVSAMTTTIRKPFGPIRENPKTRKLLLDIMREVVQVGKASGVHLDDNDLQKAIAVVDEAPAHLKASMSKDLENGKRLEVDWLSGAVVRLGEKYGAPTPLNACIDALLTLYANGGE